MESLGLSGPNLTYVNLTELNSTLKSVTIINTNLISVDMGNVTYNLLTHFTARENNENNYAIQGRALPFDNNDVVPLGFRATEAGGFTISLTDFDGLFTENQDIYLKDNFTQTEQNLKDGNYIFVSEQGIFNNRFEVVYKSSDALNTTVLNLDNNWIVYKQNNVFHIHSIDFDMKAVEVYDILGRQVYISKTEGTNHTLPNLGANQVLIVKVITTEGVVLSKKVGN